jgi:hypothetical protein
MPLERDIALKAIGASFERDLCLLAPWSERMGGLLSGLPGHMTQWSLRNWKNRGSPLTSTEHEIRTGGRGAQEV